MSKAQDRTIECSTETDSDYSVDDNGGPTPIISLSTGNSMSEERKTSGAPADDSELSSDDNGYGEEEHGGGLTNPGMHDVLLGRGGGTYNHKGNVKFRKLVNEHKLRYLACSRNEKPKVARELVQIWRNLTPPGRFLVRKDGYKRGPGSVKDASNVWYEVGDQKAREKASQCLRERTPDVLPFLKQMKEHQEDEEERSSSRAAQNVAQSVAQDVAIAKLTEDIKRDNDRKVLEVISSRARSIARENAMKERLQTALIAHRMNELRNLAALNHPSTNLLLGNSQYLTQLAGRRSPPAKFP